MKCPNAGSPCFCSGACMIEARTFDEWLGEQTQICNCDCHVNDNVKHFAACCCQHGYKLNCREGCN